MGKCVFCDWIRNETLTFYLLNMISQNIVLEGICCSNHPSFIFSLATYYYNFRTTLRSLLILLCVYGMEEI